MVAVDTAHASGGTEHSSFFVVEKDDPEFSMAEQKRLYKTEGVVFFAFFFF